MEVDWLGRVFTVGLEKHSVSGLSTMSRLLSLFFGGHLSWLVEAEESYRDRIYVVYSGGTA